MSKVLVAGGATGIGAAVIEQLRAQGDDVVLADRNVAEGTELMSREASGGGWFVHCDFSSATAPAEAVIQAAELLGGEIDKIFYNAGVLIAHPLAEWTASDWDLTTAVNLRAPFLIAQAAEPYLLQSDEGRLVFTASAGALRGHAGMPAYHATKSGLLGLVRSLADEFGPHGVTVNAICPGWVDTPFNAGFWEHQEDPNEALKSLELTIPLRRQAEAREIVGSVLYLLSEAAGYVTGQALVVDGGHTAV